MAVAGGGGGTSFRSTLVIREVQVPDSARRHNVDVYKDLYPGSGYRRAISQGENVVPTIRTPYCGLSSGHFLPYSSVDPRVNKHGAPAIKGMTKVTQNSERTLFERTGMGAGEVFNGPP